MAGEGSEILHGENSVHSTERIQEGWLLVLRLERLSADSHWAHQASGLRGALLRCLEALEVQPAPDAQSVRRLNLLIQRGQLILIRAARLIRTPETQFD
jgi:hypothetical protein